MSHPISKSNTVSGQIVWRRVGNILIRLRFWNWNLKMFYTFEFSILYYFREVKMLKIMPRERNSTSIDSIEVEIPNKVCNRSRKKWQKWNFDENAFFWNFDKILSKNCSTLFKNLFAVTRRAGCLIPSRRVIRCPGKSSGGGLATFLES